MEKNSFIIKQIAWDTFKNTGDINSFLELKQIENIERQLNAKANNQKINNETVIEQSKNIINYYDE